MSEVYSDNIQVNLSIDGQPWHVIEAKVELSRITTPNYVDMVITPDISETLDELPSTIENLIGADFHLEVNNSLTSTRSEDTDSHVLFSGTLANISATGRNSYEAIAYDPSQQAFASEQSGGSIMNQTVSIDQPSYGYVNGMFSSDDGTLYNIQTIKASDLLEKIVEELSIEDYDIELAEDGVTVEGETGSYTGGYDRTMTFTKTEVNIKSALDRLRESTQSEWWFDNEGTFHFGVPRPSRYELTFITDTSAGKTTPPYQSVRVIGSGAASQEGYARDSMYVEDKIVIERNLAVDEAGDPTTVAVEDYAEPNEPVFEYRNLEISSIEQARSTAQKIAEDLGEQQAEGTVTIVGHPEILPLDGIIMPQAEDEDKANYNENQPMGGAGYNVYKVVHRLNSTDGFTTEIHVGGITGVTKTVVSSDNTSDGTAIDTSGPGTLRR